MSIVPFQEITRASSHSLSATNHAHAAGVLELDDADREASLSRDPGELNRILDGASDTRDFMAVPD